MNREKSPTYNQYTFKSPAVDYNEKSKGPCLECGSEKTMYVTPLGPFCRNHKAEAILANRGLYKRRKGPQTATR